MPRGTIHRDLEGTELRDLAAARDHASAVAGELTRHAGGGARNWSMCVEDDARELQFDLFFADLDVGLMPFSPEMRMLVTQTSRRLGALTDTLDAVRDTLTETRMLIARSRGKPHLVYARRQ